MTTEQKLEITVKALEEIQTFRHPWDKTHPCSQMANIAEAAITKINQ